jgi:hypothetical protein
MCNLFKTKCIHVLKHSETHRIMQSSVRILWNEIFLLNLNNNFDGLIQLTKSYHWIEISMLSILRFGEEDKSHLCVCQEELSVTNDPHK